MSPLQIAERIHALLLREIDFAIDIQRLLGDARYARDVLLVCDAVPGGELVPLAALLREATRPGAAPAAAAPRSRPAGPARPSPTAAPAAAEPPARSERHADDDWLDTLGGGRRRSDRRPAEAPGGHARRATDWSRDTSGFGVTQPPIDPTVPDVHQAEPPAPPRGGGRGRRR